MVHETNNIYVTITEDFWLGKVEFPIQHVNSQPSFCSQAIKQENWNPAPLQ